jgi:hypothetical protein
MVLTAHGTGFRDPSSLYFRQIKTAFSGEVSCMFDRITAMEGITFASTSISSQAQAE